MTFPIWSILPTTADIGFIAEAPSLSELFSVSAAALQSIRLGLRPSEEFPAKKGANFTISIKRSDRVDRDLVSWLEEINWTAEDKASVVYVETLDFSGNNLVAKCLIQPAEAEPAIEIKAVTHHELKVSQLKSPSGDVEGFRARVILDV